MANRSSFDRARCLAARTGSRGREAEWEKVAILVEGISRWIDERQRSRDGQGVMLPLRVDEARSACRHSSRQRRSLKDLAILTKADENRSLIMKNGGIYKNTLK